MKNILYFLTPHKKYFITPLIIYINTLVFISMVVMGLGFGNFSGESLLYWGANFKPLTIDHGQWWRLLTSTFLHGGILHIFFNMYGLISVGIFLEPVIGSIRYGLAYIATGLLASCASIWWHTHAVISVGASGAIFGLYGLFLVLLIKNVFTPEFKKIVLKNTLIFIGFSLAMGASGGIDNAAHIGGLLSGLIIGLLVYYVPKPTK